MWVLRVGCFTQHSLNGTPVTLRNTSPGEEHSAGNMRGGDGYNERCTTRRRAPGCDPETQQQRATNCSVSVEVLIKAAKVRPMSSHFRNLGSIAYPHMKDPSHENAYIHPGLLNAHNVSQSTLCFITRPHSSHKS